MADFLTTYKTLENTIRTTLGLLSVKDYEDSISLNDMDRADKLRLARTIRNYYSHHADGEGLVKINKDMISFLDGEITKVNNSRLLVKDKYKTLSRAKYILNEANLYTTINNMYQNKIDVGLVVNNDNILLGEVLFIDIIGEQLSGTTVAKLKKINITSYIKKSNVATTTKNTPIETLLPGYYLVLDETSKFKKVIGEIVIK